MSERPEPYGSAHNLPSFVEMRQQLRLLKDVTRVVMRDKRAEIIRLERQMEEMAEGRRVLRPTRLAARDAEKMVAWDSVTGHHLGLTNALTPFLKTIKKRVDDEVFELHRQGIVHGSVTDFNNAVVATKAWNLLFAVVDWSIATAKKVKDDEKRPEPGWRETLSSLAEYGRRKKARDQFAPWTVTLLVRPPRKMRWCCKRGRSLTHGRRSSGGASCRSCRLS